MLTYATYQLRYRRKPKDILRTIKIISHSMHAATKCLEDIEGKKAMIEQCVLLPKL